MQARVSSPEVETYFPPRGIRPSMARTKASGPLAGASLTEGFLWARDFRRMRDFYHETLGLPITYQKPHFAHIETGVGAIDLHAEREPHPGGGKWFLHLEVGGPDR